MNNDPHEEMKAFMKALIRYSCFFGIAVGIFQQEQTSPYAPIGMGLLAIAIAFER